MAALDAVQELRQRCASGDFSNVESVLVAVRRMKNDVVGNCEAKRSYVAAGAVSVLVGIAAAALAPPLLVAEALSTICSLCVRCESGINALLDEHHALDTVLDALHSPPPLDVSHAAVRTLKVLVTSRFVRPSALDTVASRPLALAQLVAFAVRSNPLCATAATTIAAVVRSPVHASNVIAAGILPALLPLLEPSTHPTRAQAACDALAALASVDPHNAAQDITARGAHLSVFLLIRFAISPRTRLAACRLLTRLYRAQALEVSHQKTEVIDTVVDELISLLSNVDRSICCSAAIVLADLVESDDYLQRRALSSGSIPHLASFFRPDFTHDSMNYDYRLSSPQTRIPHRVRRDVNDGHLMPSSDPRDAALSALAALSSNIDEVRDRIIGNAELWRCIVNCLASDKPSVVLGAVRCLRSLTRSVKVLSVDVNTGDVAGEIMRLLNSESTEIKRCVSAILCNVVLRFSLIRSMFVRDGGTETLTCLLNSNDAIVRKNALGAINNLLFLSATEVKRVVVSEFGYDALFRLSVDSCVDSRHLAVRAIRNLSCSSSTCSKTGRFDLLTNSGRKLLSILEGALKRSEAANSSITLEALYAVCNIAAGPEKYKEWLMNSTIPLLLMSWITHPNVQLRVAALWCVINLSGPLLGDDPRADTMKDVDEILNRPSDRQLSEYGGFDTRLNRLRKLGCEEQLRQLLDDPHLEVQGCARLGLEHLQCKEKSELDFAPESLLTDSGPHTTSTFMPAIGIERYGTGRGEYSSGSLSEASTLSIVARAGQHRVP